MPDKRPHLYERKICAHIPHAQKGSALLFSMIFLVLLTVLGISAMGTSKMELRMAHNYQLDNDGFNFTESAVNTILYWAKRNGPNYDPAVDIIDNVVGGGVAPATVLDAGVLDPQDRLKGANPSSNVTVAFLRPLQHCPGGGSCNEYTITVTTTIPGTAVNETHTQIVRVAVAPY